MANRVAKMIENLTAKHAENRANGTLTDEILEKTNKAMRLEFDEWFAFNNLKSEAQAMGKITTDEALTVYQYLGESGPDTFNTAPLPVRIILMKLMEELTNQKIRSIQRRVG